MRGTWQRRHWAYDPALYAPARYRRACAYDAFVPDPIAGLNLTMAGDLAGIVSDAEAALHDLNDSARPALGPLSRLLLRTESIASSQIEGLNADIRDLARAEARLETGGKAGPTVQQVIGNIDAMEQAIEEATAGADLELDSVLAIHAALMAHSPTPRIAGRIRTEQNWIGGNAHNPCGAQFVPPPPEAVRALLADLCRAASEGHLPPLVQAAVVHAQFETIHPFADGNGRTGRALVHVVLRRRGLASAYVPPISVVLAADKPGYIAGLTAFRDGDLERWLADFGTATARSATLASQYLDAVAGLQERWRTALSDPVPPRADAAAWRIIDVLPAHPVISMPVAAAATGRTKAAVNGGLETLARAGVLRPLSTNRRNRSWEADGLLDLLADLEANKPLRLSGRR